MSRIPSLSREPSRSSLAQSFGSRRLSFESNDDNVFSDSYALDFPLNGTHTPLRSFPPPRQQFFDNPFNDPSETEHIPDDVPNVPISQPQPERGSTAKSRLMIDDAPTSSGLGRALSTSSRLTIPRSQSPYVGPSAPSHPYSMYPQMTRAASVASQSTFRSVPDSSFVAHARPEHPYHMYPQNTVEAEDEDITTNGIPLGFPRSAPFQSSSGGPSGELGDIVGTDGHIEQLPPYTRYADNTVAKGDMDDLVGRRLSRASRISRAPTQVSEAATNPVPLSESSSATLLPPREQFEQFEEDPEEDLAKKEGWRDRATKRTIGGLPVWGVILVVLAVLFSAIVGGVVGGVIGNKQGAERAYALGAHTTTLYLDAEPTTLGPNSSPLPTGHFQIPLNQSEEINKCIPDPALYPAWGCMDIAYIGVLVYEDVDPDSGNATMSAVFEDFSVNTQDFRYGPQPPDFNGSSFTLNPMVDKDAGELGVAMFFSVLFDKLSIIPEDALVVPPNKRSVSGEIFSRGTASYDGDPLRPSDRPWFCYWNSTMNEFFIYLNQAAPTEPTTYHKNYVQSTVSTSPTPTSYQSTTSGVLLQELTMTTGPTQAATPTLTTFLAYGPTFVSRPTGTSTLNKRSYESSAPNMQDYPKLIKMVEKRKPFDDANDYVQPYCQKMQVLDDWTIAPIYDVPTICIDEVQFTTSSILPAPTSSKKKLRKKGEERDVVADLESYCICEWTSY